MKQDSAVVKSKKIVVGTANFKVYETVGEATTDLGEPKLLEILNAQIKTNAMNALRAGVNKPGKSYFRDKALASLTMEELQGALGDEGKMKTLLDRKAAELETQWVAANPAAAAEDENDD